MAVAATDDLIKVAAWPMELLTVRPSDGPSGAVGFVMPRVASPDQLHEIYTPKSRAQAFPDADLRFIIHVAANVVRAFGTVHSAGHVIGDVNHGHLLVNPDGRVTLIDCDSFQITSGSRKFTCDVEVPLFTAPELQGKNFRGLLRTANNDRFGLAVLLFHLLYMGRHPYAGVPQNRSQSAEIEPSIRAGRFAYGARRSAMGVEQPPGTIALDTYGPLIAANFEAAFGHPSTESRPDAGTWLTALTALQSSLKPCGRSQSHQYPRHLPDCPWCVVEARTGVRLFGTKLQGAAHEREINVARLWRAITTVPVPASVSGVDVTNFEARARNSEETKRNTIKRLRKGGAALSWVLVLGAFATVDLAGWGFLLACLASIIVWPRANSERAAEASRDLKKVEQEYEALKTEWRRTATETNFNVLLSKLQETKAGLDALPQMRVARIAELTSEARQRTAYLDRFRIARERVAGIGTGRASTLASFGIETAADVSRSKILGVPGFGPSLADNLVFWRDSLVRQFRFDPAQKPAPADVRAIEADILNQQRQLLLHLQSGPNLLARANSEASAARQRLAPAIQARYVQILTLRRARAEA